MISTAIQNPCVLRLFGDGYPDMLVGELGFSWKVAGAEGAQTEYSLLLSQADGREIWNSGSVPSTNSAGIAYAGPALESNTDYQAIVQIKTDNGKSFASDPVRFSTGFMDDSEWVSDWLCSPYTLATANAPMFRKAFQLDKPLSRARLFICGLGYYELHINGRQVGDRYMDPAWTDFSKRTNYVAYDVTECLRKGENAIGVALGSGWYSNDQATPRPAFTAQLMLEYADGSRECQPTKTDDSWKVLMESWILSNSIYIGEVVDARLIIEDWCTPEFKMDRGTWQPALECEPPTGKLTPMRVEPIRCIKELSPASISEPQEGVYVIDFGQNLAGIVRLQMDNMESGDQIKIRYAEILDDKGMLNTQNLRAGQACDEYIARGSAETYQSRFTYHGFRYAEVTGLRSALKSAQIDALVMRSDVSIRSDFSTSSTLVNDIQRMCVWTESNNLHSVPTDCPQRDERLGWLNDLTVRLEEAIYNFEMDGFLKKYLVDIMDAQGLKTGAITDTAPYLRFGGQPADPVCSSFLLLPWMIYQHYGDRELLKTAWPGLKGWTDYLARQRADGIVNYSYYGDWAAPIGGNIRFSAGNGAISAITPGRLMSTGFLYMNCRLLESIASVLDMSEAQAEYAAMAEEVSESINRVYLNREEGYYATNSQAANTFMLYLDIVPDGFREKVLGNLVRDILAHDTHITTGNLCTRYILDVLADYGKIDLAYALVTQTTYPSWGYMLSRGATTTWERWEYVDSGELIGMASHDHPMYSTVSGWFYKYLAGFRPMKAGFASYELRPYFPSELDHAKATVKTVKGDATISWTRHDKHINVEIDVPFNSHCTFSLTEAINDGITLNGASTPLDCSASLPCIQLAPGKHVIAFDIA